MNRGSIVHMQRPLIALALGLSLAASAAPPSYTATRVPVPAGRTSYGIAINGSGDVAGWSAPTGTNDGTAFVFAAGMLGELGTLGGDRRRSRADGSPKATAWWAAWRCAFEAQRFGPSQSAS